MRPYDPLPPPDVRWDNLTPPQQTRDKRACHLRPGRKPGCSCPLCFVPPPPEPTERLLRYHDGTDNILPIAYNPGYANVVATTFRLRHPVWTGYADKIDPDWHQDKLQSLIFILHANGYGPNRIHASLNPLINKMTGTMLADFLVSVLEEIGRTINKPTKVSRRHGQNLI